MKTVFLSRSDVVRRNDAYSNFAFDFEALVKQEKDAYERLSQHDKYDTGYIFVTEYEIQLPDDYDMKNKTADRVYCEIFLGDVDCPQYDALIGIFSDTSIVRQADLLGNGGR